MSNLGTYINVVTEVAKTANYLTPAAVSFQIKGIVKLGGVPFPRRVVVLDRATLGYLFSGMSNEDGTFLFKNLPLQDFQSHYIVLAFDDLKRYNAEVIDFVKQVSVPGV